MSRPAGISGSTWAHKSMSTGMGVAAAFKRVQQHPYMRWKSIRSGELDPVNGSMSSPPGSPARPSPLKPPPTEATSHIIPSAIPAAFTSLLTDTAQAAAAERVRNHRARARSAYAPRSANATGSRPLSAGRASIAGDSKVDIDEDDDEDDAFYQAAAVLGGGHGRGRSVDRRYADAESKSQGARSPSPVGGGAGGAAGRGRSRTRSHSHRPLRRGRSHSAGSERKWHSDDDSSDDDPLYHPPSSPSHRRSRSPAPSYGTPHQSMGARDLPPGVNVDDPRSVRAYVDSLQHTVSTLRTRLHAERMALTRQKVEAGKVIRMVHLLEAQPSPIVNMARARVSTLHTAGGGLLGALGGASGSIIDPLSVGPGAPSVPELQRRALAAQRQVQEALAEMGWSHSASHLPAASTAGAVDARVAEEEASLRAHIAALRGRVAALHARVQREQALAQERAIQVAAFDPSASVTSVM